MDLKGGTLFLLGQEWWGRGAHSSTLAGSVADPDLLGRIRILTSGTGPGSGSWP
jgi:hypothetical protein